MSGVTTGYLLLANTFWSTGLTVGRDGCRWVVGVRNVPEAIEVERRWSLGCRNGSRGCVDRDIGLLEDWGVGIFEHLLVDDDVLPFLVVEDGR